MLKIEKRIFLIIIWLFLFYFYIFLYNSYATDTTGTVYLTSSKAVIEKDEEIEISLNIDDAKISAFNAYIYFNDSKLEYVSGPENTNVIGNRIICLWYDESGGNMPKDGELVNLKFKAREEGIATFNIDGEFYSNVDELMQINFKDFTIQIGKNELLQNGDSNLENGEPAFEQPILAVENTNLEILAIENILLNPPFESNITEYNVNVANELTKLNILAIPENENATVEIIGNEKLKEGNNLINVNVTAQNGSLKKVYIINAYRRNNQEERIYQEEQQENKKKLEDIYEAEKISIVAPGNFENNQAINELKVDSNNIDKKENSNRWMLVILLFGILVCIVFYIIKNRKSRK